MSEKPRGPESEESKNKEVFDAFDRASSHKRGFSSQYFIGDGLVIRVGWVDNREDDPDLTIELRDVKLGDGVSLIVGQDASKYTRQTTPLLSPKDWLLADKETRRRDREGLRRETFSIPTVSLEPIAQAVSNHEPHIEPEPPESETMFEASIAVEPLPSTDTEFIRELIKALSKPLD
jgi:hypothetical protein